MEGELRTGWECLALGSSSSLAVRSNWRNHSRDRSERASAVRSRWLDLTPEQYSQMNGRTILTGCGSAGGCGDRAKRRQERSRSTLPTTRGLVHSLSLHPSPPVYATPTLGKQMRWKHPRCLGWSGPASPFSSELTEMHTASPRRKDTALHPCTNPPGCPGGSSYPPKATFRCSASKTKWLVSVSLTLVFSRSRMTRILSSRPRDYRLLGSALSLWLH